MPQMVWRDTAIQHFATEIGEWPGGGQKPPFECRPIGNLVANVSVLPDHTLVSSDPIRMQIVLKVRHKELMVCLLSKPSSEGFAVLIEIYSYVQNKVWQLATLCSTLCFALVKSLHTHYNPAGPCGFSPATKRIHAQRKWGFSEVGPNSWGVKAQAFIYDKVAVHAVLNALLPGDILSAPLSLGYPGSDGKIRKSRCF